ncbi:hypothetical protein, partial [Aquisphaera insulae]|uniref:hypothetical protein n=1 Tax=Aquisphaera insulae TaxID=2712864 RepID=UPI00196AD7FC
NEDDWLLARRAPKRPTLAVLALIIGVLAVDFALVANIRGISAYRICGFDAAVLLVPLLVRSLVKHSLCDLGFTAMIIGLLGSLSMPGAHGH